jgi:hypothetical protein
MVHRGFNFYRWVLYSLISIELTLGLMTFTKQAVIEVLLATGLGWSLGRPKLHSVMLGGMAVVLLYAFVLTPFMYFGRIAYKTMGVETVREIVEAGQHYWEIKDDFEGHTPGVQRWWTRLNYANAQAFAMDSFEHAGQKGDTMALAIYALLPRVLFPSKPEMSPGQEFTMAVTGEYEEGTYTAPGVFAEAYWNGGWCLVGLTCIYIGMLFVAFSRFAEQTIREQRFEYLPVVMTGLSMGYQPNDWFAMVYVGSVANVIALYLILRFLLMPLLRQLREALPANCLSASGLHNGKCC